MESEVTSMPLDETVPVEAEVSSMPLFEFNVSEPEKKEGQGKLDLAYWTYHVYTKTTLETFPQKELVSVRRYNDFVWLRNQLVETYAGVIVPPIPDKAIKGTLEKLVTINANSLLEYRQRALRKFLVRVGAHPILCTSDVLRDFLDLSEEEFNRRKNVHQKKEATTFGQKFKELSFSVSKTIISHPPPPAALVEGADGTGAEGDQWEETRTYVDQLERSLNLLRERIELLIRRRRETSVSLLEFGKSFVKVGEIESSYEEGPLPKALIHVGHHSEHLSIVYQEQADNETIQVVETIAYYVGLTMAIKDILKHIQKMKLTRDTIDYAVNSLQDKKHRAQGKDEEMRKLELELNNTTHRLEESKQELTAVENILQEELKRFHREKQYDIKQMLKAFVDLQVEYSNKMRTSWESVMPSVEAIQTE